MKPTADGHFEHVTVCPFCGVRRQASARYDGPPASEEPPRPGDVSICAECQGVGIYARGYGRGLRVREPTDAERRELDADGSTERAVALSVEWRS